MNLTLTPSPTSCLLFASTPLRLGTAVCGAVIRRPITRELFGCVKIEDIALSLLAVLRLDSQHLCAPSLIDRRLRVVVWSTHSRSRSSSEVERESSPRYPCSASIKVCCCVVRNKIIIDHWFACIARTRLLLCARGWWLCRASTGISTCGKFFD